jgi:hypothetical protein
MHGTDRRVYDLDGRPKKKAQYLADFCGTYGVGAARISYQEWFGLFLNCNRVRGARGFYSLKSFSAALANTVPNDFWEGVTHTPDEAEHRAKMHESRQKFVNGWEPRR